MKITATSGLRGAGGKPPKQTTGATKVAGVRETSEPAAGLILSAPERAMQQIKKLTHAQLVALLIENPEVWTSAVGLLSPELAAKFANAIQEAAAERAKQVR